MSDQNSFLLPVTHQSYHPNPLMTVEQVAQELPEGGREQHSYRDIEEIGELDNHTDNPIPNTVVELSFNDSESLLKMLYSSVIDSINSELQATDVSGMLQNEFSLVLSIDTDSIANKIISQLVNLVNETGGDGAAMMDTIAQGAELGAKEVKTVFAGTGSLDISAEENIDTILVMVLDSMSQNSVAL